MLHVKGLGKRWSSAVTLPCAEGKEHAEVISDRINHDMHPSHFHWLMRFCAATWPLSEWLRKQWNGAEADAEEDCNETPTNRPTRLLQRRGPWGSTIWSWVFPGFIHSDGVKVSGHDFRIWSGPCDDIGPPQPFRTGTTSEQVALRSPVSRLLKPQPPMNLSNRVPLRKSSCDSCRMHGMFYSFSPAFPEDYPEARGMGACQFTTTCGAYFTVGNLVGFLCFGIAL